MNYTINEIPNEATEAGNGDLGILWQDNKTKKISILNLFKNLVKKSEVTNTISATSESPITSKAVSSLLTISASSATITGAPPLQNGTTIRFFFTDQITGPDSSSALSISYNGTSYSVKATSNGSLKNFTAYPIATEQTRELTKGGKTEEEKGETKGGTKGETKSGTRATVTTYVYCQAYTTLEMMFDGTQFIIMGNPVVISNSDYTVYTDGLINYNKQLSILSFDTSTYSYSYIYEGTPITDDFPYCYILINGEYSIGWNTNVSGLNNITAMQNRFGDISNHLCLAKKITFYLDIQSL